MKLLISLAKKENEIIRYAIISFWWFFWLFNIIDKVIGGTTFLWVGKDRFSQFVEYFSSIGIENTTVAFSVLLFTALIELVVLVFFTGALTHEVAKKEKEAGVLFFWGIIFSLFIFTFFVIGDQVFGDRAELLEHSLYWVALLVSWAVYKYSKK